MTLQDELEHKDQWTKVSQQELNTILDRHEAFVDNQSGGERMQLGMHDLSYLDMAGRNLSRAELPGAGKWVMRGYQADLDFANNFTGALYEERGPRGLIARRGDMVKIEKRQRPRVIGRLRDADEIKKHIKGNDWNSLHVVARGNVLMHILNGYVSSIGVDDDEPNRVSEGLIGLQIHAGDPMKVEFRNLYLKRY